MKSRGENLEKHYDQAFDYWTHIVPKRPPFVILCNFDEFWIYDFNTQLFDPVDRIKIAELPENISSLNFLLPIWKKPIFGNNWVDVTRRAADQMATVFREIVDRGEDRERAQRFILQLLVALVAEDIGLLPEQLVSELLHECADEGGSSYDLIGGLFRQMASARESAVVVDSSTFSISTADCLPSSIRSSSSAPKHTAFANRPRKIGRMCVQRFSARCSRIAWTRPRREGQKGPTRRTPRVRRAFHERVRHSQSCRSDNR